MPRIFIVKCPINGISINGDEYLLDSGGNLKTFPSMEVAEEFLLKNNIPLESVEIVPED